MEKKGIIICCGGIGEPKIRPNYAIKKIHYFYSECLLDALKAYCFPRLYYLNIGVNNFLLVRFGSISRPPAEAHEIIRLNCPPSTWDWRRAVILGSGGDPCSTRWCSACREVPDGVMVKLAGRGGGGMER